MKKTLLAVSIAAFGLLITVTQQSCVKSLIKAAFKGFTFTADPIPFQIPIVSTANTGFVTLDSAKVSLNMDSVIKASTSNQFGIDDADQIQVTSVDMTLTDADQNNNWSNFDTVHVMVTSNTAPQPTSLCVAKIPDTYSSDISGDVSTTLNLKNYAEGNTIYDILYGTNRRPTTKILHGQIVVTYQIK